jgi:hypothetical protein
MARPELSILLPRLDPPLAPTFSSLHSMTHLLTALPLVSPFLSPRTLAPTALLATPLSTSLPPLRLSVPSRSFPARRSLSARSLFSSLASPSPLARRLSRVPTARVLARKVPAAALPDVVAAVAVDAVDVVVPVVAALARPTRRRRARPLMPPLPRLPPPLLSTPMLPLPLRLPRPSALSVSAVSVAPLLMAFPPRPRSWLPTCPTT